MKCPRCGRENPSTVKICLHCATPLNHATPTPVPAHHDHAHLSHTPHSSSKKKGLKKNEKIAIVLVIALVAVILGTLVAVLAFSGGMKKGRPGSTGGGGYVSLTPSTPNQAMTLYSDKTAVLVGEEEVLYMYLETSFTKDYIELYNKEDSSEAIAVMYDDGNFEEHADDMAGDGIYSTVVPINAETDTQITYYASCDAGKSNEVAIQYFVKFTKEENDAMCRVDDKIQKITSGDFYNKPLEERKTLIGDMLADFSESGEIIGESVFYFEKNKAYSFQYSCGVLGGVMLEDFKSEYNMPKTNSGMVTQIAETETYTENDIVQYSAESIYSLFDGTFSEKYPLGSALVLNSFPDFETEQSDIDYRTNFYNELKTEWDSKGLYTVVDTDVTVLDYHFISEYNVVCISTHGSTYAWYDGFLWQDYNEVPAIILAESQSYLKNELYSYYLKNKEVAKYGGYYCVLPNFFENNFIIDTLEDTIVFSECCMSMGEGQGSARSNYDYQMANAFIDSHAKTYIGFHNSVFATYSREFMKTYIDNLIDGENSITAYNRAISEWGANHEVWYNNGHSHTLEDYIERPQDYIAGYNPQTHPAPRTYNPAADIAYPVHNGNQNATLVSQLKNGNFNQYSLFTSFPKFWNRIGDVRTVKKLGDVTPVSSDNRMSIITTGIGASSTNVISEGTEGSLMSQTFILPQNATRITFSYNLISEEPMEYVGSAFDDAFAVNISCDMNTVFSNTYESINSSTWYEVGGIDFAGGDTTVYQTNWKTVEIDVSQYAGKIISLKFIVYDVGDSIYDSACLIDNVFVS